MGLSEVDTWSTTIDGQYLAQICMEWDCRKQNIIMLVQQILSQNQIEITTRIFRKAHGPHEYLLDLICVFFFCTFCFNQQANISYMQTHFALACDCFVCLPPQITAKEFNCCE